MGGLFMVQKHPPRALPSIPKAVYPVGRRFRREAGSRVTAPWPVAAGCFRPTRERRTTVRGPTRSLSQIRHSQFAQAYMGRKKMGAALPSLLPSKHTLFWGETMFRAGDSTKTAKSIEFYRIL